MKKIKYFILTAYFFLVLLLLAPVAKAYEANQLSDCISNAHQNPATKDIDAISIQNYCECALDLIIDHGKEVRSSGYECAIKNFG